MAITLPDIEYVAGTLVPHYDVEELFRVGALEFLADLQCYNSARQQHAPFAGVNAPARIISMGGGKKPELPYIEYGWISPYQRILDAQSAPLWYDRTTIKGVKLAEGTVTNTYATGKLLWDNTAEFKSEEPYIAPTQWVTNITTGEDTFIKNVLGDTIIMVEDDIFYSVGDEYEIYQTDMLVTYPLWGRAVLGYTVHALIDKDVDMITDRLLQYFWPKANRDLLLATKTGGAYQIENQARIVDVGAVRNTNFVIGNTERESRRDFSVSIRFASQVQLVELNMQNTSTTPAEPNLCD